MLHRRSLRNLITLACLLAGLGNGWSRARAAETATGQELYQLRQQLVVDAEDGTLDDFPFLEGVLIASGVRERSTLDRYRSNYRQHRTEALAEVATLASSEQAAGLFDYLHERILTGRYIAQRTELDLTLTDGSYNCVTATVLYCELCRAAGLEAHSVAAPGHVFAQLTHENQTLPVETTCSGWFTLLTPEQREEALSERRGTQAGDERVLTDVQLIAKIFYNRGVFHLEQKSYSEAIALIRLSLRLDPADKSAQANLLAAFNNWALLECEQQHWREALRLIAAGLRLDPGYAALQANQLHAYHGLAKQLCSQGSYAEAARLLEEGYQQRPDAPLFTDGRFTIYRTWVESLLRKGHQAEARRVIAHVYRLDARRGAQLRSAIGA